MSCAKKITTHLYYNEDWGQKKITVPNLSRGTQITANASFQGRIIELPVSQIGEDFFVDFEPLRASAPNVFTVDYLAQIDGAEILVMQQRLDISQEVKGNCGCEEVSVPIQYNVIGGGGNLDNYATQDWVSAGFQPVGSYTLKSDFEALRATVTANAGNISVNTQMAQQANQIASGNATLIQGMQAELSAKASKTYVDGRFEQVVGAAPATLDTLQEIAAEIENGGRATQSILTTLGKKADISYVDGKFQPIGDYAYRSDISAFITTSTASQTFAAKSHTHAATDITGLVDYSKQYQFTANLGLSDSLNNTLLIGKATATIAVPTGLAEGFVAEVYASVGDITVSGASGVSFEANGGKFIIKQGKSAVLIQIAGTNNYILKGDIS